MKLSEGLSVIALAAVTALAVCYFYDTTNTYTSETAYERVMRTSTLRCGYIPTPLALNINPQTHEMSGILYDFVEEMGRINHLNVEWSEELSWDNVTDALRENRVDALCSGLPIDRDYAKFIAHTAPLYYKTLGIYARADESRFEVIEKLNDPAVIFAVRDATALEVVAHQEFPRAKEDFLPTVSGLDKLAQRVLDKKADIILYYDDAMKAYIGQNPGKFKELFPGQNFRIFPMTIGLPMGDAGMKDMFDSTIAELKGSKFIEKSLLKNAPLGGWMMDSLHLTSAITSATASPESLSVSPVIIDKPTTSP